MSPVFSLSKDEIEAQARRYLQRCSGGATLFDSNISFREKFSMFSKMIGEFPEHSSLQLKFIELFFYKSLILGLVNSDDFDYKDTYAATLESLFRLKDSAIARTWSFHGNVDALEKKIMKLLASFEPTNLDTFFPYSKKDVGVQKDYESMTYTLGVDASGGTGDELSELVGHFSKSSSGSGSSGMSVSTIPERRRSRRCSACNCKDELEGPKARPRASTVLVSAARSLLDGK